MLNHIGDMLAILGILLLGWGTWQYSPAMAAVVIGAILLSLSIGSTLIRVTKP